MGRPKKPDYFRVEVERTVLRVIVLVFATFFLQTYFGIYVDVVWYMVGLWTGVDLVTLFVSYLIRNP